MKIETKLELINDIVKHKQTIERAKISLALHPQFEVVIESRKKKIAKAELALSECEL